MGLSEIADIVLLFRSVGGSIGFLSQSELRTSWAKEDAWDFTQEKITSNCKIPNEYRCGIIEDHTCGVTRCKN